jgi:uncharacterized protein DUF3467
MPAAPEPRAGVIEARYANHFEVGQNEYEFVLDFGQFHAPELAELASSAAQLRIVRIVMPPPFAKALLHTLERAIAEHEREHGFIEHG